MSLHIPPPTSEMSATSLPVRGWHSLLEKDMRRKNKLILITIYYAWNYYLFINLLLLLALLLFFSILGLNIIKMGLSDC